MGDSPLFLRGAEGPSGPPAGRQPIADKKNAPLGRARSVFLVKRGNCRVLLAAGCLAQRFGTELLAEIPELDGIFA
ncbi:MAG: hypothetical protein DDT30_00434 [Dehalococcoidia bacterium]|nr:hypothetical protein [Bacillota bacterium]